MINKIYALLIIIFFVSCGDEPLKKATSAQEAGTEFIRASLDGDYRKAEFYLLKDDANQRLFEKQRIAKHIYVLFPFSRSTARIPAMCTGIPPTPTTPFHFPS
jgi:hypothetical protein